MYKSIIGIFTFVGMMCVGCQKPMPKGDADVERSFQGDWNSEYLLDNKDMRMMVKEKASFDTLSHRYKIEQELTLIYPVSIKYADISYEGSWSADKDGMHGVIDRGTVKNRLNNQFEVEPEYDKYRQMVKNTADANMQEDEYKIHLIQNDRIHLIDTDRNVVHDLARSVPTNMPTDNPSLDADDDSTDTETMD